MPDTVPGKVMWYNAQGSSDCHPLNITHEEIKAWNVRCYVKATQLVSGGSGTLTKACFKPTLPHYDILPILKGKDD